MFEVELRTFGHELRTFAGGTPNIWSRAPNIHETGRRRSPGAVVLPIFIAGRDGVHSRRYLPPTGTNRSGFFTESYSRISSSSSAIQGRFFGSSFLTRTPCHRPWLST